MRQAAGLRWLSRYNNGCARTLISSPDIRLCYYRLSIRWINRSWRGRRARLVYRRRYPEKSVAKNIGMHNSAYGRAGS